MSQYLSIQKEMDSSSEDSRSPEEKMRQKTVTQYLATKYKKSDADVTIVVGDRETAVHAWVLSSVSDVFEKMFEEGFIEGSKKVITITDSKFEIVEQLIEYIYKGTVTDIEQSPSELLKIANKYNVAPLKSKCENFMKRNLSEANALKTLIFADMHNCEKLELATLSFIKANFRNVRSTNEWTKFRQEHVLLHEKITDTLGNFTPKKRKVQ